MFKFAVFQFVPATSYPFSEKSLASSLKTQKESFKPKNNPASSLLIMAKY